MDAIIVPRGLDRDYYFFLDVFTKTNRMELIVDRRHTTDVRRQSRPVGIERRSGDRRGPLPGTWRELEFAYVRRGNPDAVARS